MGENKQVLSLLTFVSMKECTHFPWLSVPCKLQHRGAVEAHHTTWFVAHDTSHSTFKFLLLFTLWETVTCVTAMAVSKYLHLLLLCASTGSAGGRDQRLELLHKLSELHELREPCNRKDRSRHDLTGYFLHAHTHTHLHGQWTSFGAKAKLSSPLPLSSLLHWSQS